MGNERRRFRQARSPLGAASPEYEVLLSALALEVAELNRQFDEDLDDPDPLRRERGPRRRGARVSTDGQPRPCRRP